MYIQDKCCHGAYSVLQWSTTAMWHVDLTCDLALTQEPLPQSYCAGVTWRKDYQNLTPVWGIPSGSALFPPNIPPNTGLWNIHGPARCPEKLVTLSSFPFLSTKNRGISSNIAVSSAELITLGRSSSTDCSVVSLASGNSSVKICW